jgi:PAS domain S-box-containing protein
LRSLNTYREDGFGRRRLLRFAIAGLAGVCLAISASALDPNRAVSQYLQDSWGTERGWPGGSITAIAQTSDGYLWIGTDKGLVRFDGFTFHRFERFHPDPILIGPVRTLVVDASDNLWILLQNTLVFRYQNGNFELIRGETENGTTAIARGTLGAVLLSSLAEGILTYNDNRFRSLSSAARLPDAAGVAKSFSWFDRLAAPTSVAISMTQTDDGKIWLGTENQGLFYLRGGRVSSASSGQINTKINCLLPLQNSELWVGTAKGVLRWNGTALTLAGVPSSLLNLDVLSILRDRDSNIWVGTSSGLFRYNANGVSLLSTHETTGPVAALFEDREGNIWIGSTHGLERLRDSTFVAYSLPNLKSQSMGPLHVDSGGRTWIAPIHGGLRWLKGGKTGVVTADGIANDVVYSIAGTGKDDVWVGRQQGGLTHLRYFGNSFTAKSYTQADGLAQNRVYTLYRSRDGTVWSGTLNRGVSELKNGHFTNYTTTDGLAANTISSIAEGPDGVMWFGTPKGVSVMSQKGWQTYTGRDGLPSEDVNCLLQDSTGILWIGTAEGFAYLVDGNVHVPREVPEFLHAPIFGIEEDKNGRLWIATSDHVLRVPRDKLLSGVVKAVDVRQYDEADGLESTEGVKRSRSVVTDSAGRIWFSLGRGLSVVNPSQINDNSVPALPHIEAITADNNTASLNAVVQLPPSPRRITFEYTGLSLAAPGRIRFRYFLEGFDSNWSQPVAAREAVYTNLGPGSYRFRLVASNSEGLWNGPETAITLNVQPAYYQTSRFRLACVTIFVALLWALYRWRVYRLKNQEKRLRDVVETIPAMTFTALSDGSGTFVNKRWTEYTGLSLEQSAGTGWQRAIHPDDLVRHSDNWCICVATGQLFEDEARFRRAADGEYRWFLVRGVPLRDPHGRVVKWYGTLTDIEDRKRGEQEREKSRLLEANLAHINRVSMMGEMAASLAHEIKQPIAAAINSANSCMEWLAHEPPNLDRARAAATRIDKYGNRAAEIIDRIRSFYRKSPPQRELVDVNRIVNEILTMLEGEAARSSVAMHTDLDAEVPEVVADRVQLQQVFMNLMLNSIEAMKATGGKLTVKSQLQEEGQLSFSVSDTGPGLPDGNVDHIFSAFFTTKSQGSGMGLAISRSIVESHGGRLWATANDGRGVTFHFTLPMEVTTVGCSKPRLVSAAVTEIAGCSRPSQSE